MAVGRAERRVERTALVVEAFGEERAPLALDLLELVELAWHDCYGEITPSDDVLEDMLLVGAGTIEGLIKAALLGLTDWRDLRVAAENLRSHS